MNLEFLRALTAIADTGSLVSAGEVLGLSHSAVSLRIKSLEEELGIVLLDRRARPIGLTSEGKRLLVHARDYDNLSRAVRAIGQDQSLSGLLRLGAVPTTLSHLVPPALLALRGSHPYLDIHLKSGLSGELALALKQGEIDAALLSEPDLPIEGLIALPITSEELVMIIKAQSAPSEPGSWRSILRENPFIWFSRKTWAGQQIERYLLRKRIAANATMEVDSLEAIASMVRHGLGASIVPWQSGIGDDDPELRRIRLDDPAPKRNLVLMYRIDDPKASLVAALNTSLIQALQRKPG